MKLLTINECQICAEFAPAGCIQLAYISIYALRESEWYAHV